MLERVILHNMLEGEVNQHPIQLLVNYWEIRPSLMGARLDELLRHGISHIATFVPWQAVESDISHTLTRFLQAVAERKMTVSLIPTPEVGVHYPNSGLPKDVISKAENTATHSQNLSVVVNLPPNQFQLPSLFSSDFSKRYYSYLSRIDGLLADIGKTQSNLLQGVTLLLTGSYWKYFRSPQASSRNPFGSLAGDFSASARLAYRQCVEQFYTQREFVDPSPLAANRWKTRAMDEVNYRWFFQQSEEVFRTRSIQQVRKKAFAVQLNEIELFTPEADPGFYYSNFLQSVSGGSAEFPKLSALIDEAASRSSRGSHNAIPGMIHWSSVGGFQTLTDPEKQFLILKSLLLMGGRKGAILIDESEWFSLSQSFRSKAETLARSIAHRELRLKNRAMYLAPHLWSSAGILWEELFLRLGPGARMISSLDLLAGERDSNLLIVDPSCIMTRQTVQKLAAWAQTGRVVAMARSTLYTESARAELEQIASSTKRIEIDLGVPYQLYSLGEGKLIVYDLPDANESPAKALAAWQTFMTAILSVAEVQGYCRLSDSRLTVIPVQKKSGGLGLFVFNSTKRAVAADILFPTHVAISDLAVALSSGGATAYGSAGASTDANPSANRFSLEVPPCGVLPLSVTSANVVVQSPQVTPQVPTARPPQHSPEQLIEKTENLASLLEPKWN